MKMMKELKITQEGMIGHESEKLGNSDLVFERAPNADPNSQNTKPSEATLAWTKEHQALIEHIYAPVSDSNVKPTDTTEQAGSPYKKSPTDSGPASNASTSGNDSAPVVTASNAMDRVKSYPKDPHLQAKIFGDHL
jgi:hypothetical protein